MALQKQLNADDTTVGMAASEAYLKIERLSVIQDFVTIEVFGYGSAEARQNEVNPIFINQYNALVPTITGTGNLIDICYAYLKTLDEFSGATDV
jgi:hypothetical protein